MPVAGVGKMGEGGQKRFKPAAIRYISPGDVMYGMVSIVDNIVLYI